MPNACFRIQLLDTDVVGLRRAGQKLRRRLSALGVAATVEEISCFLEITRQGYMKKLPAVLLDGRCMCTGYPLSTELMENFSALIKASLESPLP